MPVLLIGAGAAAVLLASLFASQRRRSRSRRRPENGRSSPEPVHGHPLDLSTAQQRALDLLGELAVVGRESVERARSVIHETEIERAREAAHDVLASLGERGRAAPKAVRRASRGRRAKQTRSGAGTALHLTAGAARWLLKSGTKPTPRRRPLAWRS
jgi:hypothetical protein